MPATSQLDRFISITAISVPSGSRAMRDRLKSFNFCMGCSIGSYQQRWMQYPRRRPIASSTMGFEDEAEQSIGRPCRQTYGRSKRPSELTSSIVPRGTSFHHAVELEFPPMTFDLSRLSCCCSCLSGPAELGAVNPDAVQDHGQSTRQRHDRLLHSAAPGDLHCPGLEPRPFLRMEQHALGRFVEHRPHHLISAA